MRTTLIAIILAFSFTIDAYAEGNNYICPMHPHIHGEEGETCPICGMNLVLFGQESDHNMNHTPDTQSEDHAEHSQHAISLSEGMIQTIGVRTAKVQKEDFGGVVRAFAQIVRNERNESKITSRANGWIEELGISAVGDKVEKGDLLYKIHSPDIVIAQNDYILDLETGHTNENMYTYKIFHHYDVDKTVIRQIEKTKEALQNIPYYAKMSGTITEINARKGSYVTLNSVIATVQDFSTVWAHVDIAEKDLPRIAINTPAKIFLPNHHNQALTAAVDYIYPTVNPETRTGLVRLVIDNTDGNLKPGSYTDVEIMTERDQRLSVPSEAVLKGSDGDKAIVALGNGIFSPVPIKTGISKQGKTEVIDGLQEGDIVVTSSQFLIDSESSLRETLNKLSSGGAHAGH